MGVGWKQIIYSRQVIWSIWGPLFCFHIPDYCCFFLSFFPRSFLSPLRRVVVLSLCRLAHSARRPSVRPHQLIPFGDIAIMQPHTASPTITKDPSRWLTQREETRPRLRGRPESPAEETIRHNELTNMQMHQKKDIFNTRCLQRV